MLTATARSCSVVWCIGSLHWPMWHLSKSLLTCFKNACEGTNGFQRYLSEEQSRSLWLRNQQKRNRPGHRDKHTTVTRTCPNSQRPTTPNLASIPITMAHLRIPHPNPHRFHSQCANFPTLRTDTAMSILNLSAGNSASAGSAPIPSNRVHPNFDDRFAIYASDIRECS